MAQARFLKDAAIYAVGDLLIMGAGFVLLPVYSRCLKVEGFGDLEILERLGDVLAVCLLARGVPLAVMALHGQSKDAAERRRVVTAGLLLAFAAVVLGAASLGLVVGPLAGPLRLPAPLLVWTAVLAALIDGVTGVLQSTNQARGESAFYAALSFSQFVVKVVLTLWFVLGCGWGLWGVVAASLLRSVGFALLVVAREAWTHGLGWPDGAILRHMVWFGLPFLPTGLCFFMLNSGDRFFLKRYAEDAVVGYYGLGYKLAMLVGVFSMTPLYRVWSARMYRAAEEPDAARVFGRVATRMLAAYGFVGLGLCLFSGEVIRTFSQPDFLPACAIIPLIVLANAFQAASILMEGGFYVRRQTHYKLWATLGSTALITVLYAALIPTYHAWGAAVATLGGYVGHAALTYVLAQRIFPVRYEFGRLGVLAGLAAGVWLASSLFDGGVAGFLAKVVLLAAAPTVLWIGGFFDREERATAHGLVAALRASWRRLTHGILGVPFLCGVHGLDRPSESKGVRSR